MARIINRLTARSVQALSAPGRHADGDRLFFVIREDGSKGWFFLYTIYGRRREMGLGPYPLVSLAEARGKADQARRQVLDGVDPLKERERQKREKTSETFGSFADDYITEVVAPSLRSAHHVAQWRRTLGDSYCKAIRGLPLAEIGVNEVLSVLRPVWDTKNETASRLRGRIERVLGAAAAKGLRPNENPATWSGLIEHHLPGRKKLMRNHHAALSYKDIPAFCAAVRKRVSTSARAVEMLVLTAARAGELTGMLWEEVDEKEALWTIPAERMKAAKEHRVPLSPRAVEILQEMRVFRTGEHVFPGGAKKGKPITREALEKVATSIFEGITLHGFRSTFRDWAGDTTLHPREVAEAALAHIVGSEVEQAYRRADALDKRRALMKEWADYCASPPKSQSSPPEGPAQH